MWQQCCYHSPTDLGERHTALVPYLCPVPQTTLILVLSGRVPGDVDVFNQAGDTVLLTQSRYRRRVGFVPQDDILHPDLTVRENLDYSARFRLPLKVALRCARMHASMLQAAAQGSACTAALRCARMHAAVRPCTGVCV